MSHTLPSFPGRESSLPERKGSKAMSIPRRAVGSTSSVSKKTSIASRSSSAYFDSILSRSSFIGSNRAKDSLSQEKDGQRQSSPGQELWRRRSSVAQKGIGFPHLKLQKGNSSTASPPSKNDNPAVDRSLPKLASQSLPSRGLSDREQGPIPAREAPQAPAVPPMGAKISKLKEISKRKATDQTDGSIRRNTDQLRHAREVNTSNSSNSPHDRLPIPEYLTSPTTPRNPSTTPQVFIKSDDSHAYGAFGPTPGGPSTLVPNLLNNNHSRDPSETLTITSLPGVVRSPQPQKPHATKTILTPQPSPPIESAPFSPSIASTTPTITSNPHSRQTSRTTTSRATSLSYSYFPLSPSSLPAPGTVLPAPPITFQHVDCFQSHRFMRRSRNNICPLECQTCSKADFEQQWKCTWCCLRICGDCMAVLVTVRKDLRAFLGLIGRDVPVESAGKSTDVTKNIGERSGNANPKNESRRISIRA
ncbi:hypothetical protein DSL72_007818 [Monilinia vaccinii-corymbosi]|uniref:Uncharacterized protein n=1 Tax=Monilinia vaccinii-corymbosi TaxID=61207 RepID=A0A8A3PJ40_9HELO|nr:hypothetical protein DSL72_007818 [Monilinia vaccinii-corymbosi]